ncbi:winged helix-turn-helix domain-containing protein [Paraburkholderia sp. MMS20-SJTR3]|uniref:Winged helix-turn-helix domain-containing protein n=1 Tax=Paraburkholderia sejongensis TaxID=2886946 RepID=A0ABS8JQX1_9BURK|nr:winged helix-turn-helix domain-containing protein [Paraburkholderia sp. MMS20-SJTR3]MCC8392217.1 winged helix-turn-helix domain-containing protein [Paraburkholderia sp. MMS20-SJTR3]
MNAGADAPATDSGPRDGVITVGELRIDLHQRTLQRCDETLPIGSRAFDILAVLARAGGRLVSKDELMNTVWPHTFVEENNVQVHLSGLRKLLGADRDLIVTVPGHGYRLVQRRAPSAAGPREPSDAPRGAAASRPACARSLVGRDAMLASVDALLAHARVLTLVGTGGVGKSTLGREAARRLAARTAEPLRIVSLAGARDKAAVLAALARHCDAAAHAPLELAAIVASVSQWRGVLLLDDVDPAISAVAEFVDALTAAGDQPRLVVTSREPLRIMPETVFRVAPLEVPAQDAPAAALRTSASVQLFLGRAHAMQAQVRDDGDALAVIAAICRRVGGVPLAIELAAARLTALGLDDILRRLDDPLTLLAGGYRTALPRHRSLRANVEWSYALLDANQHALLHCIACFDRAFALEALCAVADDAGLAPEQAVECASQLVAKSLLCVEFDGLRARYRLPDAIRLFALEMSRTPHYAPNDPLGARANRDAVAVAAAAATAH